MSQQALTTSHAPPETRPEARQVQLEARPGAVMPEARHAQPDPRPGVVISQPALGSASPAEHRSEPRQASSPSRAVAAQVVAAPPAAMQRTPSVPPALSSRKVHVGSAVTMPTPRRMQSVSSAISLQPLPGMRSLAPTRHMQSSVRIQTALSRAPSADAVMAATPDRGRGCSPRGPAVLQPRQGSPQGREAAGTALERSLAALKASSEALKCTAAGAVPQPSFQGQADVSRALAEEVLVALAALQGSIEQQQQEQSNMIAALMAQWEQRFASVLQCLKTTTNTAASMNERSSKFLRLGEVLEGALDQMSSDSKDVSVLSQKVGKLEASVNWLADEVAEGRAERSKWFSSVAFRTREPASGSGAEQGGTHRANGSTDGCGLGGSDGSRDHLQEWVSTGLERISWLLSEECAERRKLAREVRSAASEASALQGRLNTTNDQFLKLAREVSEARGEVRQVVAELLRARSAEASCEAALHSGLAAQAPSQLFDGNGATHLVPPPLSALPGGIDTLLAPAAMATSACSGPCSHETAACARPPGFSQPFTGTAIIGSTLAGSAASLAGVAALPRRALGGASRVEPLRTDVVKEIAAAMASI